MQSNADIDINQDILKSILEVSNIFSILLNLAETVCCFWFFEKHALLYDFVRYGIKHVDTWVETSLLSPEMHWKFCENSLKSFIEINRNFS